MINHPHHQHKWVLWINMVGLVYWVSHKMWVSILYPGHHDTSVTSTSLGGFGFACSSRAGGPQSSHTWNVVFNMTTLWGLLGRVWGCMLATYKSYGVCWAGFGAVCWQPTSLMGSVGPGLGMYVGNLQVLWGLLCRVWGCMLATYKSYGVCWAGFGAVCWQPTNLMGSVGPGLGLYVGNLQVLWGLLDRVWGCILATYRSYGVFWAGFGAVYWQPTSLVGPGLGLYVGNLQVLWVLLDRVWGCILATYKSYGVCWAGFGAVCWQPTGLMGSVGQGLGLYIGNLQVLWGLLGRVWETYKSYGVCWAGFGAVCWQPTGLMGSVGQGVGLYIGNLQVLWGLLGRVWGVWGCMLATYKSYVLCWTGFGAVCWQPTGLMGSNYALPLDRVWGCMLATYRSHALCWTGFLAVCWQPTGMGSVGPGLGLYVANLQVLWGLLGRVRGCMLATYRSHARCWTGFRAVCWQPTGLMGSVGPGLGLYVENLQVLWALLGWVWDGLGLYVGNLQVFCALLDRVWGWMLATYKSYGLCWAGFRAFYWQPTGLLRSFGPGLGLYAGNLQVLWCLFGRVWGCMLATYRSFALCWTGFGAVCWQPTGLMGSFGQGLGLYIGNLQVLWALLGRVWGCMLATYRSHALCWTGFGAVCWQPAGSAGLMRSLWTGFGDVCWQPTSLMRSVGPKWGWMLATYRSYGVCWTGFGAVCWQLFCALLDRVWGWMLATYRSYGLPLDRVWGCMLATYRSYGVCWTGFGAVCWQLFCALLDRVWGWMLATYRSYAVCWAGFGAVCWQPTGLMGSVGPGLGLYVGNLQVSCALLDRVWVLCALLDRVWGCLLATYRSYAVCWAGFGAVCWQPTGLMGSVGPGLGLYVGNQEVSCSLLDRVYVGNQQVLWGLLDRVWDCMLTSYRSYGVWWAGFGAVCWQPTGLMRSVGQGFGLYVGNLQVLWGLLDWVWGCMLATYKSYALCWTGFGAVCWQPTSLMRSLWAGFGAVCWQPASRMRSVGPGFGLYVGNLQVLWALLGRVWGCMLATYKSYALCWTEFGAVCWQPTSLMRSLWAGFGAACWQPASLMRSVGPGLGLYVGNLQVLCGN